MALEIKDVSLRDKTVNANAPFRLEFKLSGAQSPWFEFPFLNDSVDERLLQFAGKESTNAF